MSTMFHMLGVSTCTNTEKLLSVKKEFVSHPNKFHELKTPVCFDDEQWFVFKRMLARIAKERKLSSKKSDEKPMVTRNKVIRNHVCEEDLIEIDEWSRIVKICIDSFKVETYKNFTEAVRGLKYHEKENIIKCLRGQVNNACGYYWVQK